VHQSSRNSEPGRQTYYNVTMRRVLAIFVAVEGQKALHILSMCL